LWDIYGGLETIGDIAHFFLRDRRTMKSANIDPDAPWNKRYLKELSREQFAKLIYHLKKNNYIKVKNLDGKKAIILTEKGLNKAILASFRASGQKREIRKDGKWIMVIFDIPKKDDRKRGILRSVLQNLGYKMFQKSVWITPYDVFDKTGKLLQFYDLEKYVRIFLIEEMD